VLPVPDLEPKKRRGGKRYRKMKEKYGITEVQKAANRIKFNEAEEEFLDGEEVVGLGMVGKDGSGKLRKLQVGGLFIPSCVSAGPSTSVTLYD